MLQLSQFTQVRRGAILLLVPCFLTACNVPVLTAETRDPNRLWCNEHDVYEDDCCICHPELAAVHGHAPAGEQEQIQARDPNRLWCNEHGLYEDECLICHPELAGKSGAPSTAAKGGLFCGEHGLMEVECGICHPELLAGLNPGQGLKIRFQSMASAEKAGVRTGYPALADWSGGAMVLGQVAFNKNQLAYVTPLLDGVIKAVHVDAGDRVKAGQLLAEISAPELATERSVYAKAAANVALYREVVARAQKLVDLAIAPRQDLEIARAQLAEAEAELAMARQRMLDLGLTPEEVNARGERASVFPVRAPFAGTVTERNAVAGAAAESGAPLFQVADLSTMWMELSIPEGLLINAREGATVTAEFDPLPGMRMEGKLQWIAPSVDETTRMVQARAVLENPDGLLRNAMFGRAELAGSETRGATVVVPPQAIQYVDGFPVVFAKLDHDLYETRLIRTGPERRGSVPVLEGLRADEEIALGESYVLKSELLKARLGAGCVHD
ncbi:MAG: efflux RND transporter periplasmic adaptor subunit [Candidatus Hydrogenedentes bacterium]|nr:efflux RND transporter periplasmic adaptor subunit [Candidatus Hydrogenedentota bacterium]